MSLRRILAAVAATFAATTVAVVVPAQSASAADCVAPWNASSVYWGGNTASYNGHNWSAKWWTQNETPGTAQVWADQGACGGGTTNPPNPSGFVVSEAQFNQMFPSRNPFYTYNGLVTALSAYPAFAGTGSDTVKKQEAAAFLANVSHETGGLVHIVEQNEANYPHYCDTSQSYGCPAGNAAYYGRGPIQLSWNFNYKAAGDALGLPLLTNPWLVQNDAAVAWKTGIWYWMTQNGPGTMTPHNAMVNSRGFGETIRSINGSIECNGGNPAQVQSRVNKYQQFTGILGVTPGGNLYC
ncbi:glycoside hydrolase family 19 protein [Amycolatopsis keratiniphila]|uniref:glycoside hydrolase family 19 protein n=1 Tax=Amycolatopsis keratiniphila TaxID=129921 RepID=UPI000879E9B0|nr:glycoside hydrolase family 19 protein [Amycolatopsis keratiniphila]OLZ55864.1 chitinase [Amycolatopsis keratiniphila subsp. nogabecina]SDU49960.1 Predicted chitinase [Amycolatopsis keratiniphila]